MNWLQPQVHIVSGKGGTGKSTVAAALALALAAEGREVLLCEVEGRQGIARIFDVDPLPYAETKVAPGVHALHIDAESALMEYLAMYYKLGRAGKALDRFGVIDFATTIAPGVRDVLLTGKVYEATNRSSRNKEARVYDAIVLDAPPTGRISQFLNVNSELAGLAKVGPIKSQADSVMALFRSKKTAVHLVTVLEEMPVQETIDGIAQLSDTGLRMGAVIVNLVRPPALVGDEVARARRGGLDGAEVKQGLVAAGVKATDSLVQTLLDEASEHAERLQLEAEQRALVDAIALPKVSLPLLPGGAGISDVGVGGVHDLAAIIREQMGQPA